MRAILILLVLVSFCFAQLNGWNYRQELTIDKDSIYETDANFWAVIATDYVRIKNSVSSNIFTQAKADGSDIAITDSDGTTLRPILKVIFTPAGALCIAVKISVDATRDWSGYIYWGNADTSVSGTLPGSPILHWYVFDETLGTTVADLTLGQNLTNNGATIIQVSPSCLSYLFDGVNDNCAGGDVNDVEFQDEDDFSIFIMFKQDNGETNGGTWISRRANSSPFPGWTMQRSATATGPINFLLTDGSGPRQVQITGGGLFDGNWHQLMMINSSTELEAFYDNGQSAGTSSAAQSAISYAASEFYVGDRGLPANVPNNPADGNIDNVMIFEDVRTDNFMKTMYSMTMTNQEFWGAGAVEDLSDSGPRKRRSKLNLLYK